MISSDASKLVGLPPPLRGRVGERGMPRAQVDEISASQCQAPKTHDEELSGSCDRYPSSSGASGTPHPDPPPQGGRERCYRWFGE